MLLSARQQTGFKAKLWESANFSPELLLCGHHGSSYRHAEAAVSQLRVTFNP